MSLHCKNVLASSRAGQDFRPERCPVPIAIGTGRENPENFFILFLLKNIKLVKKI